MPDPGRPAPRMSLDLHRSAVQADLTGPGAFPGTCKACICVYGSKNRVQWPAISTWQRRFHFSDLLFVGKKWGLQRSAVAKYRTQAYDSIIYN